MSDRAKKWVCPDCWSSDVQCLEWLHANTLKPTGGETERMYCTPCDEEKKSLELISYRRRLEELLLYTEGDRGERYQVFKRAFRQELCKQWYGSYKSPSAEFEVGTSEDTVEDEMVQNMIGQGQSTIVLRVPGHLRNVLRRTCVRLGIKPTKSHVVRFIHESICPNAEVAQ